MWQRLFKSWYVYDENYLKILVKYIEYNPVKTHIVTKVWRFKWSMSGRYSHLGCLNYALREQIDLQKNMTNDECEIVKTFSRATLVQANDFVVPKVKKSLKYHFENKNRDIA